MKKPAVSGAVCKRIVSRFADASVMVVGDVMLDEYVWGEVTRISPEAPVPVVKVGKQECKLGGAANVAYNLKTLGVTPVLVGLCGADSGGERLRALVSESGMSCDGVFVSRHRMTTRKTRIMARHQQVVRADYETADECRDEEYSLVWNHVKSLLPDMDAVILSDYAKGVLGGRLVRAIIRACREHDLFVAVDPKKKSFEAYTGASLITPNFKEACLAAGTRSDGDYPDSLVRSMARSIARDNRIPTVLITLGERGMALYEQDTQRFTQMPTAAKHVFDVTGAGDTVISVFTASAAAGASAVQAACMANQAAGLTVAELGTAAVTPLQLLAGCGV